MERVQYLPVETQIIHYPQREKNVVGQSGQYIKGGVKTVGTAGYGIGGTNTQSYVVPGSTNYQTTYTTGTIPATGYVSGSRVGASYGVTGYTGGITGSGVRTGYTTGGYTNGGYTTGGYTNDDIQMEDIQLVILQEMPLHLEVELLDNE